MNDCTCSRGGNASTCECRAGTIKVYHFKQLSDEQVLRINAVGWIDEHARRYLDVTTSAKEKAVRQAWDRGEYELVAEVQATDVEEAFRLTNHIDHDWRENPGVVSFGPARSTSVGDVFMINDAHFVVAPCGTYAVQL